MKGARDMVISWVGNDIRKNQVTFLATVLIPTPLAFSLRFPAHRGRGGLITSVVALHSLDLNPSTSAYLLDHGIIIRDDKYRIDLIQDRC